LRAGAVVARRLGGGRYAVADAIGLCLWAVEPERRRRTAANHRRSDPAIGAGEARRRARASFREYARTVIDFLWANGVPWEAVERCSRVTGMEHVRDAREAGRGGILALAHVGSWDMAATVALTRGIPLTTVMAPVGSPAITSLVSWARECTELEVFTPESAARGLVRALRRGRFVCLLCDIPGAGPTVVVDYCGGPVVFTSTPAWLARLTGAPLIPVDCWRGSDGYEIEVHPAIPVSGEEDDRTVMQRVARVLEAAVRRHPDQWYPFGEVYTDGR
jgi:phosphatidylinositol dimannoside acyltransferase